MPSINWEQYADRIRQAEQTGDASLVDLVADRALRAVVAGRKPALVNPSGLSRDIARSNRRIVNYDVYRVPTLDGPESTLVASETESDYWQTVESRLQHLRKDARETCIRIARALADGYSVEDASTMLGISRRTGFYAVDRLRAALA